MTDEELAEERAAKFTDINFNEPDNYGSEKEVGHFSYSAGFLAGLKAGRPKWHKVADGDLPKNASLIIIAYYAVDKKTVGTKEVKSLKEIVTEPCFYLDNQGWTDTSDGEPYPYLNKEGVVIAWCEIPVYPL